MMTYAEFDELVPKLPYLWLPQWHWHKGFTTSQNGKNRFWTASISCGTTYHIDMHVSDYEDDETIGFGFDVYNGPNDTGFLRCSIREPSVGQSLGGQLISLIYEQPTFEPDDHQSELIWNQFTVRWQPYFRRSCWLSGCNIECTAHEKLEWTTWREQRERDWGMWIEEQEVRKNSGV